MTIGIEVLHLTVVGPFVRYVEGGRNGTAIGITSSFLEQIGIEAFVQIVDRVIKGEQNHLGNILGVVVTCRGFSEGKGFRAVMIKR